MIKHLLAALLCLLPALGFAQDKSRAILVLDASGSMWGQIDGKAKITIAQEVIGELLQSLPANQELGLTVYGHRRKGDCSDIETMILPGGDTRDAIMMAVSAITPKGKTPLSAAVIQAAEALKYTEERATVILVSDGRETCNLDPCAVGRNLEKAGIDFTAHVIGFDISNAKDRAELQCLAEETGGTFRTASNADELGEALKVIAEPDPVKVTFRAVAGENGPVIETQLIWWLGHDDKIIIDNTPHGNNFSMDMLAGSGRVEVMRPEDEAVAEAEFMVSEDNMTVTLVLPQALPEATIDAPAQIEVGTAFKVVWDGPNSQISGGGDFIALSKVGSDASGEISYAYTKDSANKTVELVAPVTAGTYELRYVLNESINKVLASRELLVTPVTATVDFTNPAVAGGRLAITWQGPAKVVSGGGDYIAIAKLGSKADEEILYSYIKDSDGNVVDLEVPTTPGTYEVRYILNGRDNIILASKEMQVVPVKATLEFASPTPAGGKLAVTWAGPGGDDYISIAQAGMGVSDEVTYAYLSSSEGNTVEIDIPTTPGTYELRYIQKGNVRKILTIEELVVEPVSAALEFTNPAPAGGKLAVTWDGPRGNDYIAIAQSGMGVSDEVTYVYLSNSEGNTVEIDIPKAPGVYEMRYIQKGNERKILAVEQLDVVPMKASLQADETAIHGEKLQVTWSGPAHRRDTIIIAKPGSDSAEAFASVAAGSPAALYAPMIKGDYEIRYIYGALNKVLATIPLKVE